VEIIIQANAERATGLAARIVSARIRARPDLVLGLATGRTMERIYERLVEMHRGDGLDFSGCSSFNLDEYVGLEANDPNSYLATMRRLLFDHVNFAPGRTHVPDGRAADLEAAARQYEAAIRAAGGIGLQLLGIGETGHIGFNEPLSALMSRTRDKTLTPRTREQNASFFGGDPQAVPTRALTMGVGTILEAEEILLVATGPAKADILARALEGPLTATISASALQLHPRCRVIADEAAATRLANREYYDFVFGNEPEWAPYRDEI
jgi:glucosamine-6-phosphate deaminase